MQAGAAQLVSGLNQSHLQPILRAAKRCRIPARSAAYDRHVINCVRHLPSPIAGAGCAGRLPHSLV